LLSAGIAQAHLGGHGEVKEAGKYGGVMGAVVKSDEAKKGHFHHITYKAELVKTQEGKLSLYIYDNKMNQIKPSEFAEAIEVNVEVKKKGKFSYVANLSLQKSLSHYEGQLSGITQKPFNLDLT